MSERERLVVLGATGSIGRSAFDVVDALDRFDVVGVSCDSRWEALAEVADRWPLEAVAIADREAYRSARSAGAFDGIACLCGPEGLAELAAWESAQIVLNGVVGAAGLPATLAAIESGKRVALANKESLVVGGDIVMASAEPGQLVPVDSEHNAIWQLLEGRSLDTVRRVILTASGGPFRETPAEELAHVTAADALAHPTWDMGPKITIDSATLANKGLEIIEAHHLFGLPYDRIDVVVHPQSIVHGLVELVDGTLFAELGEPDMRAPIRAALSYPERVPSPPRADLMSFGRLTLEAPDTERFPALGLARDAGRSGGTAPAVFNAANEVAVGAFLAGGIGFPDIAALCASVLDAHDVGPSDTIESLLAADRWARDQAAAYANLERTSGVTPG